MSAADISHAIQDIGFLTAIRESSFVYPVIMATHLMSIAAFGGLILMTDLRLLGLALTDVSITDVVKGFRPWKYVGFCIMVTCGLLLGLSESDKYYANPYFLLKMFLLAMVAVHAFVFRPSVYTNTEALDRSPQIPVVAKRAGALSLIIWIGIACCGRWIAYYEAPRTEPNPRPAVSMNSPAPGNAARITTLERQNTPKPLPAAELAKMKYRESPQHCGSCTVRLVNKENAN
jgi:hypothetical protein